MPDPLPVLQGRTPGDYLRCAEKLQKALDQVGGCICPTLELDDESCPAEWHTDRYGLPELVGVGSVCRRELRGPEGLLTLLDALDRELPRHVRLHLFGVKGDVLPFLRLFPGRVMSVDSMAWDAAARKEAQETRKARGAMRPGDPGYFPCSVQHRAGHMRRWYGEQVAKLESSTPGYQPGLFGGK